MPDSKITALASIGTGTDPAVDPLVIVDVSDTTMAASGTTKKVTLNNLLACSPTATLASAAITGNLTVQTNKLFVNAGGVAVGTTSVFADFQVQRSTNARLEIDSSATGISYQILDNARTGYLQNVTIASQHLWYNGVTEAMRLNSTGLGVGVTPTLEKLQVNGGIVLSPPTTPATLTTNGQLTVNATSNTNLRFSYRGSDGVTRVANITLA